MVQCCCCYSRSPTRFLMPPSTPPRSTRGSIDVFATPASHFQALTDSPARPSTSTAGGRELDLDVDAELAALDALTDDEFDNSDEHLDHLERAVSRSAGSTPGASRQDEMEEEPLVGRRWREEGKEGLLSVRPRCMCNVGLMG